MHTVLFCGNVGLFCGNFRALLRKCRALLRKHRAPWEPCKDRYFWCGQRPEMARHHVGVLLFPRKTRYTAGVLCGKRPETERHHMGSRHLVSNQDYVTLPSFRLLCICIHIYIVALSLSTPRLFV